MDTFIRRAEPRDIEQIALLNAEVQALHASRRPDHFRPATSEGLRDAVARLVRDGFATVWVAERTGVVLAYAAVRIRHIESGPYLNARTCWELEQIGVAADHHGSGLGRALVERIQAEAHAASVSSLELQCWSFNRDALEAFSKLGFLPKVIRLELRLQE